MVFWFAVAVLAAAVTFAVTRPLLSGAETVRGDNAADADVAVYKDQLIEIDAELQRGTLTLAEAVAARTEIGRRLIARSEAVGPAAGSAEQGAAGTSITVKSIYAIASAAIPAASLALYLWLGAPGQPGQPLAARLAAPVDQSTAGDLMAKVEARLREHPEDGKGWDVIAPVYLAQGKFQDAASAYATAMRRLGSSVGRLSGFAEARIRADNGIVAEDARKALEAVLAQEPQRKEPRIWLAIAKEQDGDREGAARDYRALIADAPADAEWVKAIEARLANVEMAQKPSMGDAAPPGAGKGPTPADVAAAEAMTPDERAAMITKMVDGLATRLKTEAKDFAGWSKLIRAYQLMGRKDDAVKALADARTGLAGDETALKALTELAERLGLNS
jgi:cytochrome c-type biogenesis protein CcmH